MPVDRLTEREEDMVGMLKQMTKRVKYIHSVYTYGHIRKLTLTHTSAVAGIILCIFILNPTLPPVEQHQAHNTTVRQEQQEQASL